MQDSFQTQCRHRNEVFFDDAVWHEDKLFVENLIADEIADPILVVQVKNIGHNGFNNLIRIWFDLDKKVPER